MVCVLTAWLAAAGTRPMAAPPAPEITVFAAASTGNALAEINAQYEAQFGEHVRLSLGSSGTTARQIDHGAPADLYVSANVAWMDWLQARGLVDAAHRRDVVSNRLAVVAPRGVSLAVDLARPGSVAEALGARGRLVIADPDHAPAGTYAREALKALRRWAPLRERMVRAQNVRAALVTVARAEAALGVVYASDAFAEPGVAVVAPVPSESHGAIVYPAALLRRARAGSARYFAHLSGPEGRAAFAAHGFLPLHMATGGDE